MTTTRELQANREFGALVASLRGLEARRAAIRGIGEQLHAAGGMGAMLRMSDAVQARLGVRAAVRLDKLWNGVGQQWWA